MPNGKFIVPIIDKNGKSTHVYRSDSSENKGDDRVRNIKNTSRMSYPTNSVEQGITDELRTKMPRAHFFADLEGHPSDINSDFLTIRHDLDPYNERSDEEIESLYQDFVLVVGGYLQTYEEASARGEVSMVQEFLDVSEIAERPTSITQLEAAVKESGRDSSEYDREQAVLVQALQEFSKQFEEDH